MWGASRTAPAPTQPPVGADPCVRPRSAQYTNNHFLTDTTKDEKWLVLVGRPSLAASRWRALRPAPPSFFHIKIAVRTGRESCSHLP
jgi:hypothetical protein